MPNYNGLSHVYRGRPILKMCLESISRTNYKNYKIVMADDCSTDGSIEYVRKHYPNVYVTRNIRNGGYAKNTNNGIRHALKRFNPKYIVQCSNDITVGDDKWLDKLVKIIDNDTGVGAVGCKLVYPNGRIQATEYNVGSVPRYIGRSEIDNKQYDYVRETTGVNAALVIIRSSLIKKIGLLDENFYMGFDDADYAIRIRNAGYKIIYNGLVKAVHLESATIPAEVNDKRFYLVQVGYIYFAFKHLGFLQIINAVLHELAGAVFSIDKPDERRGIMNLHFRNRSLWRLWVSIKAIFEGYNTYVDAK